MLSFIGSVPRPQEASMNIEGRKFWLAFYVLCLGDFMIVLDTTIVNVALPSVQADLGFSDSSLSWVLNAYLLTFGGFLLLGGRLGDIFGHRRLFMIGISTFTLASLVCGVATSQEMLVVGRGFQGLGGAAVSAVALSLTIVMFHEVADRAKAMGTLGFVASGGGTVGVILGGVLTDLLSWHWIFLVNLPVGVAVYVLSMKFLPLGQVATGKRHLDIPGAAAVTSALMLAVYAIVGTEQSGWTSTQTLSLLGAAGFLLILFLGIEGKTRFPLMPLRLFRLVNIATANIVSVLMAAGLFASFFIIALYMQRVLGYDPLHVGLAYIPMTIIWGATSLRLSDKLVMRFGIKRPLVAGLTCSALGMLLFARLSVGGDYVTDVLPAMILQGFGIGIAFNPLLLAAMSDVGPEESGIASGIVNTSFMMGGALGLAILNSLATLRKDGLLALGADELVALNSGYNVAFLLGAAFTLVAVIIGAALFRPGLPGDAAAVVTEEGEEQPMPSTEETPEREPTPL